MSILTNSRYSKICQVTKRKSLLEPDFEKFFRHVSRPEIFPLEEEETRRRSRPEYHRKKS